jgi:hypothetical protein
MVIDENVIRIVKATYRQRVNSFFLYRDLIVSFSSPKVEFPYKLIVNNKNYYTFPPSSTFLQDGKNYQLTLSFNRSMVPTIISIEEIVDER